MSDTKFKPGQSGNPNGRPKGRKIDPRSSVFAEFLERNKGKLDQVCDIVIEMALARDWKAIKLVIESFIPKPGIFAPDEGNGENEISAAFSATWGAMTDEEKKAVFRNIGNNKKPAKAVDED